MRQGIKILSSIKLLIYLAFALIIFSFIFIMIKNWFKHQNDLENFIKKKVNSKIYQLKDLNRGSQEIVFKTNNQLDTISLPLTFEVKKYNIIIGDSLNKVANSNLLEIFRTENSVTYKLCETEL